MGCGRGYYGVNPAWCWCAHHFPKPSHAERSEASVFRYARWVRHCTACLTWVLQRTQPGLPNGTSGCPLQTLRFAQGDLVGKEVGEGSNRIPACYSNPKPQTRSC